MCVTGDGQVLAAAEPAGPGGQRADGGHAAVAAGRLRKYRYMHLLLEQYRYIYIIFAQYIYL